MGALGDDEGTDGPAVLDLPTPTIAPAAVRDAVKARLLRATLGVATPADPGARLGGRYRLLREIGRGGMGVVWEAELEPLGKRVAVKTLRKASLVGPSAAARFLREAMAVSAIMHEHIVRVDDFGTDERGEPYLVMELLDGRSLADLIAAHGPMPWPRVAEILLQLCDALAAAHRRGIVHRDLKPANVLLVRRDDGRDHCKLLDFGLCKPLDGSVPAVVETHVGAMVGTPAYMAPEQIQSKRIDGRADLYALGCVAFEMLTGRLAFPARGTQEVIELHLRGAGPVLPDDAPWPAAMTAIVRTAIARDRGARFADADEMAAALRRLLGRPPVRARLQQDPRIRLWSATVIGTCATVLALALVLRPAPEPLHLVPALRVPRLAMRASDPVPATTHAERTAVETSAATVARPEEVAAIAEPVPTRPRRKPRASPRSIDPAPPPPPPPAPEPRRVAADHRLVDGIRDPFAGR